MDTVFLRAGPRIVVIRNIQAATVFLSTGWGGWLDGRLGREGGEENIFFVVKEVERRQRTIPLPQLNKKSKEVPVVVGTFFNRDIFVVRKHLESVLECLRGGCNVSSTSSR